MSEANKSEANNVFQRVHFTYPRSPLFGVIGAGGHPFGDDGYHQPVADDDA